MITDDKSIKLPINLAVYGTLKKGYGNHYLIKECLYMGEVLLPNMRCYMGSSFPMAWYDKESSQKLKCEVYLISDQKVLDQLHSLEGHPDFFRCVRHPEPIEGEHIVWFYQCEHHREDWKHAVDELPILEWSRT